MLRDRLTTIWSLGRRAEMVVRIFYRVRRRGRCRVFEVRRVKELKS